MSPEPPSPSDGTPLPPRHRPMLGDLAKDTTEMDLWAFDDDLEDLETPTAAEPVPPRAGAIPSPRESVPARKKDSSKPSGQKTPEDGASRIRMNVNKPRLSGRAANAMSEHSRPESDFDDLEAWDDVPAEAEIDELPAESNFPEVEAVKPVAPAVEAATRPEPETPPPAPRMEKAAADEFSPVPKAGAVPVSLRPHLGLNSVERIGLACLLVVLLGGCAWFLATTVFRLPKPVVKLQARDFPIKGGNFRVDSADCYWRKPIIQGADADICRRGTLLLPVIELATSGGSSTVRVFFKDDAGTTVGDPIIRKVGNGVVKIAATAGIEDAGIFAAYRTGNDSRWTAQVFEIPSGDVTKGEARKLFEMEIPAERR